MINKKLTLKTVGIGQDFVVKGNDKIEAWAINLIENSETFD